MYIYIYICHTLIVWARFLWSRPRLLAMWYWSDQEAIERSCACERRNGAEATWYWSGQEAIDVWKHRARAEMEQEQSKHDRARERRRKQRDTASEESKARETRTTLCSRPLCHLHRYISSPTPSTYTLHLHATHGYNGYLIAYFRISFCTRHSLRMRIPSIYIYILSS